MIQHDRQHRFFYIARRIGCKPEPGRRSVEAANLPRQEQTIPLGPPRFAAIEAFRALTPEQHRELERCFVEIPVAGGTCLVHQGDEASALYFVETGRFEVLVDGQADPVAQIGSGSTIGEIAFFAGGARTATVRATRDSLVLRLERSEFDDLVRRFPQMWSVIAATLAKRLADTTSARLAPQRKQPPRPHTIAICPAGPGPLDPEFLNQIRTVLTRGARTLFLDGLSWREEQGTGAHLDPGAETAWLNEQELCHDLVVFVSDPTLTEWSRKAIRQADLVVCVARHGGDGFAPPPNPMEAFTATLHKPANIRLVLIHERSGHGNGYVFGTRHWLDTRPAVGMHHHVAHKDRESYERLARFLMGKALGLVACGGGAFSAAHIGCFQAFAEAHLSFDIMGGTSGGAAMTAAMILVNDPDEIERRTHDIFVTRKALRRWTVPRYSLLDTTELDHALADHFTSRDIEDLWTPFFAISTNLSRGTPYCHRRGPLWQAIRASSAIPALLPPAISPQGDMLVDGCLTDNVPLNAMHALKSGPNIAVDFAVPEAVPDGPLNARLPSRPELLWSLMSRSRRQHLPNFPSPPAVLLRALMLNRSKVADALTDQDVLLEPPMPAGMNHLDWHRHADVRKQAYDFTRERLAAFAAAGHPLFPVAAGSTRR